MVEVGLFCGYDATHEFIWDWSPQNAANNINGLTAVNRTNVYTLAAGDAMLQIQLEMTTRITTALKPYDNVETRPQESEFLNIKIDIRFSKQSQFLIFCSWCFKVSGLLVKTIPFVFSPLKCQRCMTDR